MTPIPIEKNAGRAATSSRPASASATTAPAGAAAISRCRSTTRRTWDDYDSIRWYLAHGRTLIYVEKKQWYLLVMTRCTYLDGRRPLPHLSESPQGLPRLHDG